MIKKLIDDLKRIKKLEEQKEKTSQKRFDMDHRTHSIRSIEKTTAQLNWLCMELEKAKIDFARLYKWSEYDVWVWEQTFEVSWFHNYKH